MHTAQPNPYSNTQRSNVAVWYQPYVAPVNCAIMLYAEDMQNILYTYSRAVLGRWLRRNDEIKPDNECQGTEEKEGNYLQYINI
ncbi:hypothetical protein E2C01_028573 [Portunus trituberculatus]|uniref:Uncharacterized protein n=1 Tax=Portunus trituberculatus TaxID=210409 RepID=A0A5B7EPD7_PORTR|nr:hypothetical protein [Portunus trituberculatus]